MVIKKFLNKLNISVYSIILVFLALIAGLFKEIIVISIILVIHEFGHYYFINKFNWNINKINIYPFGGVCILDDDIDKPLNEEFLVTIFGPLTQELLFIVIIFLYKNSIIDEYLYTLFKDYNITILLFNLLPIIPLDGSKILNVIINKFCNFRISYMLNIFISIVFLSIFFILFKKDSSYYLIISFLIYQIIYYYKNRHIIFNRFILERSLRKHDFKNYKKINNIKKMHRNKRHFIKINNSYITENKYMKLYKKSR